MEPPPGLERNDRFEKRSRSRDRRRRDRSRSRDRSRRRRKEKTRVKDGGRDGKTRDRDGGRDGGRDGETDRFRPDSNAESNKDSGGPPADWPGHLLLDSKKQEKDREENSTERRPKPTPRNAGKSAKIWVEGLKRGERQTIQVNFALRELFGKYGTVADCDLKI